MKNLKPTLLCSMMLPAALSAQERPNILYIMTDQQTANAMSCAGNTDLRTPNMDKLAERGIRFTNAYCSMPLSGPSRGAMFSPEKSACWKTGLLCRIHFMPPLSVC